MALGRKKLKIDIYADGAESTVRQINTIQEAIAKLGDQASFEKLSKGLKSINVDLVGLLNGFKGVEKELGGLAKVEIEKVQQSLGKLQGQIALLDPSNARAVSGVLTEIGVALSNPQLQIKELPVTEFLDKLSNLSATGLGIDEIEEATKALSQLGKTADQAKNIDQVLLAIANIDPEKPKQITQSLTGMVETLIRLSNLKNIPATEAIEEMQNAIKDGVATEKLSQLGQGISALERQLSGIDSEPIKYLVEALDELDAEMSRLDPSDIDAINASMEKMREIAAAAAEKLELPIDPEEFAELNESLDTGHLESYQARLSEVLDEIEKEFDSLGADGLLDDLNKIRDGLDESFDIKDAPGIDNAVKDIETLIGRLKDVQGIAPEALDSLKSKFSVETGDTSAMGMGFDLDALKSELDSVNADGVFDPFIAEIEALEAKLNSIEIDDIDGLEEVQSDAIAIIDQLKALIDAPIDSRILDDFSSDLDSIGGEERKRSISDVVKALQDSLDGLDGDNLDSVKQELSAIQSQLTGSSANDATYLDDIGDRLTGIMADLQDSAIDISPFTDLIEASDQAGDSIQRLVDTELNKLEATLESMEGIDSEEAKEAISQIRDEINALVEDGGSLNEVAEAIADLGIDTSLPVSDDVQSVGAAVVESSGASSLAGLGDELNALKLNDSLERLADTSLEKLTGELAKLKTDLAATGEGGAILAERVEEFEQALRQIPGGDIEAIGAEFKDLGATIKEALDLKQSGIDQEINNFKQDIANVDPTNLDAVNEAFTKLGNNVSSLDPGNSLKEIDKLKASFQAFANGDIGMEKLTQELSQFEVKATDVSATAQKMAQTADTAVARAGSGQAIKESINKAREGLANFMGETIEKAQETGQAIERFSMQVFMIQMAFQQAMGAAQAFYTHTIGRTETLNKQILSAGSAIAGTQEVFRNGISVDGMTEAIESLEPKIRQSLKNIERDTMELVGVTSDQMVPLFQILATNAGSLTEQSKQWPDAIKASEVLTGKFAAAMGTLGLPLEQARQEITSIIQGQITMDSQIAKQIGLNNTQIEQWKSQGVLVDKLAERMEAFVEGNKLGMDSIEGYLSNIQDIFNIILREAAEPFYEPVVAQLKVVYEWVKKNEAAIKEGVIGVYEFVGRLIEITSTAIKNIYDATEPLREALLELGGSTGQAAQSVLEGLIGSLTKFAEIMGHVVTLATPLVQVVTWIMEGLDKIGALEFAGTAIAIGLIVKAAIGLGVATTGAIAGIMQLTASLILNAQAGGMVIPSLGAMVKGMFAGTGAASAMAKAQHNLNFALAGTGPAATGAATGMAAFWATLGPIALAAIAIGTTINAIKVGFETFEVKGLQDKFKEAEKGFDETALNLGMALAEYRKIKKEFEDADSEGGAGITDAEAVKLDKLLTEIKAKKDIAQKELDEHKKLKEQLDKQAEHGHVDPMIAVTEARIAELEKMLKGIDGAITQHQKKLDDLGNAYAFLALQTGNAMDELREGRFQDETQAQKKVDIIKKNTETELQAGKITEKEAIRRYELIADSAFLSAETRIEAEKKVTALMSQENDRQIAQFKKKQTEIQRLVQEGKKSQEQASIESAQLDEKEAKKTLANIEKRMQAQRNMELRNGIYGKSPEMEKLEQEKADTLTKRAAARRTQADATKKEELLQYDLQIANLEKHRANRTISEEQYSQKLADLRAKRANKEIQQLTKDLAKLSKTDVAGRTEILIKIAQLETQNAERVRQEEDKRFQNRILAYKTANQLLNIEIKKTNLMLQGFAQDLEFEQRGMQLIDKAIDQKRRVYEAMAQAQRSAMELAQTSLDIATRQAERGLGYIKKLQDENIKGTTLERVLKEELAKLGINYHGDELKALQALQKKEMQRFNAKVRMLQFEQQIQKDLLEMDLLREESQAKQNVLLEKQNLLKAQMAQNEARMQLNDRETDLDVAQAEVDKLIKEGASKEKIAAAVAAVRQAQLGVQGAQMGVSIANQNVNFADQILGMAEDYLANDIPAIAKARREALSNQQQAQVQQINAEGAELQSTQRVAQAEVITQRELAERDRKNQEGGGQITITDGPGGKQKPPAPTPVRPPGITGGHVETFKPIQASPPPSSGGEGMVTSQNAPVPKPKTKQARQSPTHVARFIGSKPVWVNEKNFKGTIPDDSPEAVEMLERNNEPPPQAISKDDTARNLGYKDDDDFKEKRPNQHRMNESAIDAENDKIQAENERKRQETQNQNVVDRVKDEPAPKPTPVPPSQEYDRQQSGNVVPAPEPDRPSRMEERDYRPTELPAEITENRSAPAQLQGGEDVAGKLDTLIAILGPLGGDVHKVAEKGAGGNTIAPVINNQFESAEDKDVWAKVSKQVLGVIDNVIPDLA